MCNTSEKVFRVFYMALLLNIVYLLKQKIMKHSVEKCSAQESFRWVSFASVLKYCTSYHLCSLDNLRNSYIDSTP